MPLYVGDLTLEAVLLLAGLAVLALAAGVHEAADADPVADGVLRDLGADLADHAGDLVAGHHREQGLAPLLAGLVDVGVADAGVRDVDHHVVRARVAALDGAALERLASGPVVTRASTVCVMPPPCPDEGR